MTELNFNPFPELETERLRLREVNVDDKKEVFQLRSDKNIMKFIPRPLVKNEEEAIEFIGTIVQGIIKRELINWAITLKDDNKLIGIIGFYRIAPDNNRAEVGYILSADFHKKGIMREALLEIINYGFNKMKLHTIEAVIDPRNAASENILIKSNFTKEAHFRENFFYEGEYLDSVHYTLHRTKQL
jgi:[ribosomal protein S5]-alanine N-acetyltransferase